MTELFDDLYILNTLGSVNNTFLGDVRVDKYLPNGNGNASELVNSAADSVNNYSYVDDATPDGDSTYVQSAVLNAKDTYLHEQMTHTPSSIFGIQISAQARKDDEGTRSLATVLRSGGANTDGDAQALTTSYVYYSHVHETDPATAVAWTKAGFNASEIGVKVAL
jgi:hypothetical protein